LIKHYLDVETVNRRWEVHRSVSHKQRQQAQECKHDVGSECQSPVASESQHDDGLGAVSRYIRPPSSLFECCSEDWLVEVLEQCIEPEEGGKEKENTHGVNRRKNERCTKVVENDLNLSW